MSEHEELSPRFKEALTAGIRTVAPFWGLLGLELVDVKKGWAKVRLPFEKKLTHALGIAHGGAVFALADSAIAMALLGLVERHETFTTVEIKINFIRPFRGGEITAEAKIVHKGGNIAIGEADVMDDRGNLVAKALATLMIMDDNREKQPRRGRKAGSDVDRSGTERSETT